AMTLVGALISPPTAAAPQSGASIKGSVHVPVGYLKTGPAGVVTITEIDTGSSRTYSFWATNSNTTKLDFEFGSLWTGRYRVVYTPAQPGVYGGPIAWTSDGGFPGDVGEIVVAGVGITVVDFDIPAGASISGSGAFPVGLGGTEAAAVARREGGRGR